MIDSHCHLTDPQYASDIQAVLERARAAGVQGVVTISSTAQDAEAACLLARLHDDVWCSAGIHPHEASSSARDFPRIVELVGQPRVVAIGETGLDYHYDNSPRAVQRAAFERHLDIAAQSGLPVVVHSREAVADTIAMLRAAAETVRGVLHCFSGDRPMLDTAIELGWHVSFAGVVTFRRFDGAELVRQVPDAQLLIETDGPYLAPVPHRGRRNEPAFLRETCTAVAGLRGTTYEALSRLTAENARSFYAIRLGRDDVAHPAPR